jgi:hypothetical protein
MALRTDTELLCACPLPPADRDGLGFEGVQDGSPLEACFFLGRLREAKYELNKADKDDVMMKVRPPARPHAAWFCAWLPLQ